MSDIVGQLRATIFRRFWVPYRPALMGLFLDLLTGGVMVGINIGHALPEGS